MGSVLLEQHRGLGATFLRHTVSHLKLYRQDPIVFWHLSAAMEFFEVS